jgi:hypothetical protein
VQQNFLLVKAVLPEKKKFFGKDNGPARLQGRIYFKQLVGKYQGCAAHYCFYFNKAAVDLLSFKSLIWKR